MADIKLTPEIEAALAESTYSGNNLFLTGQLSSTLYKKVNAFIEKAGGRWSKKNKCHEFPSEVDPKTALMGIINCGIVIDEQKALQAFYTPVDLAEKVVAWAQVTGCSVLEPSFGGGALIDACLSARAATISGIDIDKRAVNAAEKKYNETPVKLKLGDFTEDDSELYERVVMNPPFTRRQDSEHVLRAYNKCLLTGGILVSIVSPTGLERIREILPHVEVMMPSTRGLFRRSGTDVSVCVIRLKKV